MASTTTFASPAAAARTHGAAERYYLRFGRIERTMHAILMITFVGCALTGVPLLFAAEDWARGFVRFLGGFQAAGLIHRVCAGFMIVIFVSHVLHVFTRAFRSGNFISLFWGPNSMVPQPQDIIDIYRHFKWFVGAGPRPQFDRFTYWEKFDYWAVFWGMFIIGGSGLLLWFPTTFSVLLPGWMFNVATIVHGEEALLAVGFIFTIHFFNGHLRPEKFPMDTVIFTGRIPEHELKGERATEYARLVSSGRLAAQEATPPSAGALLFGRVVGGAAVILGVLTIVMIFYSVLL
ncbi:MAG: formate dehydrogenase subunit gamma [Gemmatimonadota bacterium]